jgi:hypothetical protein
MNSNFQSKISNSGYDITTCKRKEKNQILSGILPWGFSNVANSNFLCWLMR